LEFSPDGITKRGGGAQFFPNTVGQWAQNRSCNYNKKTWVVLPNELTSSQKFFGFGCMLVEPMLGLFGQPG
jgi:hypothetical protein